MSPRRCTTMPGGFWQPAYPTTIFAQKPNVPSRRHVRRPYHRVRGKRECQATDSYYAQSRSASRTIIASARHVRCVARSTPARRDDAARPAGVRGPPVTTQFRAGCGTLGLIRWFVGSLVRWFVGSLVRWFVGSLVRWFVGSLVRWFVGSLVRWFVGHEDCAQVLILCHCGRHAQRQLSWQRAFQLRANRKAYLRNENLS